MRHPIAITLPLLLAVACMPAASPSPPAAQAPSAAATAASAPATAAPTPPPRQTLRLAYSATHALQSLIWVAQDAGLFEKHGLETPMLRAEASALLVAIQAGEVDVGHVGSPLAILAADAGLPIVALNATIGSIWYDFVGAPGVRGAEDLRGREIAASSRPGTLPDMATRLILRQKFGLDPARDVTIRALGDAEVRLAGLRAGQFQATLVDPGQAQELLGSQANVLVSYQDLRDAPFNNNLIVTPRQVADERGEALERFERAFVEAVALYKAPGHRDEVLAILAKYLQLDTPAAAAGTYDIYAPAWPRLPALDRATYDATVAAMNEFGGNKPVTLDYDAFVDPRPLQRVQASGFVDALTREY